MNDSYYLRLIYDWLTNYDFVTSADLTQVKNEISFDLVDIQNKLDTLDISLGQISAILSKGIQYLVFFGLLWFVMQFIQKRWYTS